MLREANTQVATAQLLRPREADINSYQEAAVEQDKQAQPRVYTVTLIEEGWGNKKDRNYYPPEAIIRGVEKGLFEGVQAYADHPSATEEVDLPERSVRDLVGWYDDAIWNRNPKTGKVRAQAKLHILPDAKWLAEKIDSVIRAGKRDLLGLSILALGSTEEALIEGEWGNKVKDFVKVRSVDVVTQAGARGRVEEILEAERQKLLDQAVAYMHKGYGYGGAVMQLCREHGRRRGWVESVLREGGVDEAPTPDYRVVADELTKAANSENMDELVQSVVRAKDVLLGAGETELAQTLNASLDFGSLEGLIDAAAQAAAEVYALADNQIKQSSIGREAMAKKKAKEQGAAVPQAQPQAPGMADPGDVKHDHGGDGGFCEACMEAGRQEEAARRTEEAKRRMAEKKRSEEARRTEEAKRSEEARRTEENGEEEEDVNEARRREEEEEAGYGLEDEEEGFGDDVRQTDPMPASPTRRFAKGPGPEEEEDMDEAGVGSDAMDTVATGTAGSQARQDVKKPFQESQRERRLRMENTQLKKRLTANQAGAQKLKESNQVLRGENRSLQVEKALAVCRNRAARLLKEAADTLPEDLKPFVFDEMKHRDERAQRGIIKKYQALVGVRGGYESVDGAGGKDVSGLRESGAAGASSDFGSFLNQRGVPLKAN